MKKGGVCVQRHDGHKICALAGESGEGHIRTYTRFRVLYSTKGAIQFSRCGADSSQPRDDRVDQLGKEGHSEEYDGLMEAAKFVRRFFSFPSNLGGKEIWGFLSFSCVANQVLLPSAARIDDLTQNKAMALNLLPADRVSAARQWPGMTSTRNAC